MDRAWRLLIQEDIPPAQPMSAELALKVCNASRVARRVVASRKKLKPDRILAQPAQTKHPLQRNGKIAAALEILRGKTAADKNGHAKKERQKRSTSKVERESSTFDVGRFFPSGARVAQLDRAPNYGGSPNQDRSADATGLEDVRT